MKNTSIVFALICLLGSAGFAQTVNSNGSVSGTTQTSISKNGNAAEIESGTQIAAQLQNSLDVKKAKVGDQVILKTTKAVKQNGQVVLNKGAKLIGQVTEVQQKTKSSANSKISVVFDKIQQGDLIMPVSATIVSLTQVRSAASLNDNVQADVQGSSSTSAQTRSSSSGGGLLGGVTNTVGSAVNTTTNVVGGVTDAVGQTVNGTTRTVGGTLKGIQVSQATDVSAGGSSTLSLQGGNLQIEKGTTFNLRVSGSASVETANSKGTNK
jgi:phenylpyruvate tautomerase PptA (4-oxalocrotonate tautomerase family)